MIRTSLSALCVSLIAAGAAPANALPADSIGSAVTVVNLVTAQLSRETRTLNTGDDVHQNEVIEVGLDASSEFRLKDETKLSMGPGSRLVLDRFVYDPAKSGGSIFLNLAKGTFRFITGIAQKPAYVIRVPGASITVRGTIFHVRVDDNGQSSLLLEEGAVRVCNDRGTCRDHSEIGRIIPIGETGDVGKPTRWTSLPGVQNISFDDAFPFVGDPNDGDNPKFTRSRMLDGSAEAPGKADKPENTEKPKKTEKLQDASYPSDPPSKQVKLPKADIPDVKKVRLPEPKKTDYPRRASASDKVLDKVATRVPDLVGRIRERRSSGYESHDNTGNSLAAGGMFGNGYKKAH